MHIAKLDLKQGRILIDSAAMGINEKSAPLGSIEKLCSPPIQTDEKRTQYRLLKKVSIFGKSADGVIEVEEGRVFAVTFLFDLIEFFESSVLESKVLKACETSLNINFASSHPSMASLNSCEWAQVTFLYDAKQGDLSLDITFRHGSTETSLNSRHLKI
ncbi:hypothetical protein [Massilia sp. Root335]|uniref:hypothetical protein n=1 Tax=Massilia sp. Root335 TaxID=1736517 RepID=UPI000AAD7F02|nr:hypothetical protein [Massilia sp. Root335]